MNNKYSALTGMKDILSPEVAQWQQMEECAHKHFQLYHYQEIRTPLLEETPLFKKGIGQETAIVQKEMYTFLDKNNDSVTLRPEGTASVVRAYIEHHLDKIDPITKLYYMGPMFRYERPQKGRLRQFHQLGCELIGTPSPKADAEVISLLVGLIQKLSIKEFDLELNSIGCLENQQCRPTYLKKIQEYFEVHKDILCKVCQNKLTINPLRILDCKNEACQKAAARAPVILDFLCASCKPHFDEVLSILIALKIRYAVNPKIVRGLDYYDKTAFELTSSQLGAQNAFAGGGRYSGLVSAMGGPPVSGIGFAIGLERLVMLVPTQATVTHEKKIYIAFLGTLGQKKATELTYKLRQTGLVCEMDYEEKSLKSQLRRADKLGFTHVVILGENEIKNERAQIKNLMAKTQKEITFDELLRSS